GLSPPLAQSQNPTRKKAFISYSHKDKKYLERLRIHLMGYLLAGSEKDALDIRDDVWYDAKIPPGADWKEEIRKALAYAKVAVLLVNADFLGSDFIREYELPTLLEAAQAGEVQILSVLLGPCAFAYTPLSRYQVMNPASEPLMGMKTTAQEVVWAKLAEEIFTILNSQK
ncbi:MAG TPA: toll/interleukin-1 receptor domain-containing protein, partial [Methylomirabilota bacterium]|nr:toll/interleukin-1 receptor domain-containing protein [Methylomirabilota bacterium]